MALIRFFVPLSPGPGFPDAQGAHAQLAAFCGVSPPLSGERVYSIAFWSDGGEWTATVGKPLSGKRTKTVRRKGKRVETTTQLRAFVTVLAIFEGKPASIVTDQPPFGTSRSEWHNPILAGQPHEVDYFTE
jgi:hypothetical protein